MNDNIAASLTPRGALIPGPNESPKLLIITAEDVTS